MSARATFVLAALLGCGALFSPALLATTMPERGPGEVAAASELVIEGTVLDARVQIAGGRIVTVRTVRVERVLRSASSAAPPPTLSVALPGGIIDGYGQRVAGTPELEVGGRYVLCLSEAVVLGARTIVGLWQGVWRVATHDELVPFTHAGPAARRITRGALFPLLVPTPAPAPVPALGSAP
ncbi:MAG: hypothetical protein IT383_26650 [Deltaproteobacteria bacterium]|nr:hypothetical protein [Deltaproteobacteria bacterium]